MHSCPGINTHTHTQACPHVHVHVVVFIHAVHVQQGAVAHRWWKMEVCWGIGVAVDWLQRLMTGILVREIFIDCRDIEAGKKMHMCGRRAHSHVTVLQKLVKTDKCVCVCVFGQQLVSFLSC